MKYVVLAALVLTLIGCAGGDGPSHVFDTPDSYGPAGRFGNNGGAGTVHQRTTQPAPRTPN